MVATLRITFHGTDLGLKFEVCALHSLSHANSGNVHHDGGDTMAVKNCFMRSPALVLIDDLDFRCS